MERLPVRKLAKQLYSYSTTCRHRQAPASSSQHVGLVPYRLQYEMPIYSVRHLSQSTTHYSNQQSQPKGFFSRFIDNVKSDLFKDKEIKENLKKFREERERLEDTDAIKQAREKFKQVEEESIKEANVVIENAKEKIKTSFKAAAETEIIKKTMKIGDQISSKAKDAAEGISKQGEYLKESAAFKTMSEASKTVEKELDDADILSKLYTPPSVLVKRCERATFKPREVSPNEDVSSVDLHKDTKWERTWNEFKDKNPYVNKVFEYKMKYDESDNPFIRITRNFVDKVGEIAGGLFQTTDLSTVLTEICKVDPTFDINNFLQECEKFIVPNILEAMQQNKLDILSDWCYEAVFNVLSQPQKEAQKLNLKMNSKIIDLQNFELALGKMMDQGPVLVVTFQAQQVTYVTDMKGNVVEGDPDKIIQNSYVMAFCRDQNDLDPNTAWRLIDVAMQPTQFSF